MNEKKPKICQKRVNFFKLIAGRQGGIDEFRQNMEETYNNLKNKKYSSIPTLEINDDKYYIEAMDRLDLPDEDDMDVYCWLIDISRVDVNQEIAIGDLTKEIDERRTVIEGNEDTGPIVDSQIIFDPFRNIIGVLSTRGGVTLVNLKRFISKLIDKKGIKLEIILDENGIKKIGKLDIVHSISYVVATPDNFKTFKDNSRGEMGDMAVANYLSGEKMQVKIESSALSKSHLVNKIASLRSSTEITIDALSVEGLENGKEETINLIKNKLIYFGNMQFEEKITIKDAFEFLKIAYLDKFEFIKSQFRIQ